MCAVRLALAVVFLACVLASARAALHVMPWFCLERCHYNASQSLGQLADITRFNAATPTVDMLSFERYDLGPNSTLVVNAGFTDFNRHAKQRAPQLARIAMVTTVQLDRMRELFRNPTPFIDAAVRDTVANGIHGLNIDFEPDMRGTPEDAAAFCGFMRLLREQLWLRAQVSVSVDVASWNSIWNIHNLSAALGEPIRRYNPRTHRFELIPKGAVATMNTYTYNNTVFLQQFLAMYAIFNDPATRIPRANAANWMVGLETWLDRPSFTEADVMFRLEALRNMSVCSVTLWDTPLDAKWWKFLRGLHAQCAVPVPSSTRTRSHAHEATATMQKTITYSAGHDMTATDGMTVTDTNELGEHKKSAKKTAQDSKRAQPQVTS